MPFERLIGALAFLALIPFIAVYLKRPKPLEQQIPSLMFFVSDKGVTRFHSFFQRLVRNFLFLVQLLALSLLAFSVMGFFVDIPAEKSGTTVIVLDGSASMQTVQDGSTRFDQAVGQAKGMLRSSNSIVLAANIPRVVLEDAGPEEARRMLSSLKPLDTTTNLGDAIFVARDIIGSNGEIIVLSDFIATEGIDPLIAKRSASQNSVVRFINLGGAANNIGIVDLKVSSTITHAEVKNFNSNPQSFSLHLFSEGVETDTATMQLPGFSKEQFSFDTLPGKSELRIDSNDDFPADDAVYISVPQAIKARTLLITNVENSNLEAALLASPTIELEIARPPVISDFDYDVILVHEIDVKLMLPGHYNEIERAVKNGSSVVITGQQDLSSAKISFLPVELTGIGNLSRNIANFTNYFTDGIDFGVNELFLKAVPKSGTTTIVTSENSPVLALSGLGTGRIVYYGLIDSYSTFKSSPSYPAFWNRLINFLTNTQDLNSFNYETGRIEAVSEQVVLIPSSKITTDRVLFDKSGYYTFDNKIVAANLLSEGESDVGIDAQAFSDSEKQIRGDTVILNTTKTFTLVLAIAAIILLLFELFYVKFRGDL